MATMSWFYKTNQYREKCRKGQSPDSAEIGPRNTRKTRTKEEEKPHWRTKMSEQEVLDEIKRIEEYVDNCTPEDAWEIMTALEGEMLLY